MGGRPEAEHPSAPTSRQTPGPAAPAPHDPPLGGTVLLRVAGLPCADWAGAADPGPAERFVRYEHAAAARTARARELADRLGRTVVPHPRLAGDDRRAVLALRRRLHGGGVPGPDDCRILDASPAVPPRLAAAVRDLAHETETAAAERAALDQAVTAEQLRLGAHAWGLACSRPVLREFLAATAPEVVADAGRRLAAGGTWDGKQLRKRGAYLWRVLGRIAAKTTPRGWAGQTATARLAAGAPETAAGPAGDRLLAPGTVLGALAAGRTENVHLARARHTPPDLRTAGPDTLLAPAPLHFTEPPAAPGDGTGRLRCYVVDPQQPGRLRQVVLRRTRALETVLALLADGPVTLGGLEAALAGGAAAVHPTGPAPGVLRGFLQHLLERGVLQVCTAPRRHHTPWTSAVEAARHGTLPGPGPEPAAEGERGTGPRPAGGAGWFLDSYRRLDAPVPAAAADRVAHGLRVAARIAALRAADTREGAHGTHRPASPPGLDQLTGEPRPVSELLARWQSGTGGPPPVAAHQAYPGWPAARCRDSGYGRLLARLADASGAAETDLDDALLDSLGAPPAAASLPDWPLDCLLRPLPGPGPVAVLESASSAGMLDARFADGLATLHGAYPNADAYRAFLAAVERRTGVRFVELLVPPLAERAANAVRRPVTTGWWTGDPDPTPYYGPHGPRPRYLPLDRITVRRGPGGRLLAEADGRRIVPVHHATRTPVPPYDLLVRALLAAGHPAASWMLRLDRPDTALPGSPRLPRITAAGGALVLSPATWRVPRGALWRPGDPLPERARTLALLRHSAGLPRYAFLRTSSGGKPVPADLASLTALHLVERLCARQAGDDLLVEEMLPAPGDLLLRDPLHHGAAVAAQLLLRLPHDRGAEDFAEAAARTLCAGPEQVPADVPDGPSAAAGRAAGAALTHGEKGTRRCPRPWNSPTSTR
ncbi:lantibiotic dehydratase [Streptomyces sp. JJ36]|uniref:lantibiotic dehydratase n=1 Tax=Streptomyces sp. JJ36 TaxID=2736645 RepID=UPI001F1AADC5|nr:lantibiotic dehydratase [Streptomyces sp. JJ36]MCF6522985.1 lantibiotic dehydratase [Streptomyces sp. JJ36]